MVGQTHLGLGWVIGVLSPTSDRRLRAWCAFAAILPDADVAAHLLGRDAYVHWHHKPGHNVFVGVLCVAAALVHFWKRPWRERAVAVFLVALCFASHILTDMKLSGWEVYFLWPVSDRPFSFQPMLYLDDPVNTVLNWVFMTVPWLLAFWKGVTPLELISPRLDKLFLSTFRKKDKSCATCGAACNNACDSCGAAACMKHGKIGWSFRMRCPACALK